MKPQTTRIRLLQATTLLLIAAPFVAAGIYVAYKHQWAQTSLDELGPRHARLQGLRAALPALNIAVQQAENSLKINAYPAALDATQAGNDAQQRIRTLFEATQHTIISLQILEAKETDHFQRINLGLQTEGTMVNLQEVLLKLKEQSPAILIETMSVQSTGPVRPASTPRLTGNFTLTVLRARS